MEPSYIERVVLANQYKILRLLDPDHADEYDDVREALERGFESYYMRAFRNVVDEETLVPEGARLVIEAMDLHRALQVSYEALEDDDKEGIEEHRLDFPGFDGNNEGKLYSYAEFVVETEGMFPSLRFAKDRQAGGMTGALLDRFNSHMPMAEIYRERISRWKSLQERFYLSAENIRAILERG